MSPSKFGWEMSRYQSELFPVKKPLLPGVVILALRHINTLPVSRQLQTVPAHSMVYMIILKTQLYIMADHDQTTLLMA